MTQSERLLAALRRRNADGVTHADFMGDTIDGGPPIPMLGSRLHDLRRKGHDIIAFKAGSENRFVLAEYAGQVPRHWRRKKGTSRRPRRGRAPKINRTPVQPRLAALREQPQGTFTQFRAARMQVLQLIMALRSIEPKVLWESAPEYDVTAVLDELLELDEHIEYVTRAIQSRVSDDKMRAKIAALRDTTGRTPEEAAIYLAQADRLERTMEARLAA